MMRKRGFYAAFVFTFVVGFAARSEAGIPDGACCGGTECGVGLCCVRVEGACTAGGGVYIGDDTVCETDTCSTGACCGANQSCNNGVLGGTCAFGGNAFLGAGSSCPLSGICPVPTVSQWGMLAMGLLLLIGGTRVLQNRKTLPGAI